MTSYNKARQRYRRPSRSAQVAAAVAGLVVGSVFAVAILAAYDVANPSTSTLRAQELTARAVSLSHDFDSAFTSWTMTRDIDAYVETLAGIDRRLAALAQQTGSDQHAAASQQIHRHLVNGLKLQQEINN